MTDDAREAYQRKLWDYYRGMRPTAVAVAVDGSGQKRLWDVVPTWHGPTRRWIGPGGAQGQGIGLTDLGDSEPSGTLERAPGETGESKELPPIRDNPATKIQHPEDVKQSSDIDNIMTGATPTEEVADPPAAVVNITPVAQEDTFTNDLVIEGPVTLTWLGPNQKLLALMAMCDGINRGAEHLAGDAGMDVFLAMLGELNTLVSRLPDDIQEQAGHIVDSVVERLSR